MRGNTYSRGMLASTAGTFFNAGRDVLNIWGRNFNESRSLPIRPSGTSIRSGRTKSDTPHDGAEGRLCKLSCDVCGKVPGILYRSPSEFAGYGEAGASESWTVGRQLEAVLG
jgi:hypothetical protein